MHKKDAIHGLAVLYTRNFLLHKPSSHCVESIITPDGRKVETVGRRTKLLFCELLLKAHFYISLSVCCSSCKDETTERALRNHRRQTLYSFEEDTHN